MKCLKVANLIEKLHEMKNWMNDIESEIQVDIAVEIAAN